MEKKLSDYLHLYLGCECMMTKSSYHAVHELHLSVKDRFTLNGKLLHYFIQPTTEVIIKPLLRPLSDMTEEEKVIGQDMVQVEGCSDIIVCNSAESFRYLLSKGFDLFGLTEAGLAIDKTKLPAHA